MDTLQAELRALRQRVAELEAVRALLESAAQGIVVVDPHGDIVLVNARLETMFGYRREELLGQKLEVLVPVELRAAHLGHRTRYAADPHVRPMGVGLDLTAQRKDGSRFPVEISLSYTETDNGVLQVGFVTDISERKRAEDALRRNEAQARAILEAAGQAILIVDERGTILSVNRQAELMCGSPRERLIGVPVETLLPERLR